MAAGNKGVGPSGCWLGDLAKLQCSTQPGGYTIGARNPVPPSPPAPEPAPPFATQGFDVRTLKETPLPPTVHPFPGIPNDAVTANPNDAVTANLNPNPKH